MNKHGGARKGAGRKKLPYKTRQVNFLIPEQYVEKIKALVKEASKEWASESLPSESLPQKKDAHQSV